MGQEPDHVGQLEVHAARREHLRELQHAPVRVVASDPLIARVEGDRAHLDAQFRFEPGRQPVSQVGDVQVGVPPQPSRPVLQGGEVVHRVLQDLGDLLRRAAEALVQARRAACVVHPLQQVPRGLLCLVVVAVQGRQGPGELRGAGDHVADLVQAHLVGFEERVAEDLPELCGEPRAVFLGEGVQIHTEASRQLDQQRGRQRAAVVLDQVQVAGGDVQFCGQLRLGQASLSPQNSDLSTHAGGLGHVRLYSIYKLTACRFSRVNLFT